MAIKLISLKRSKEDKRGDKMATAPAEAIAPDYPWGTCLHLEQDELKKLGIKKLPEVGAELEIQARVKVTRVTQSAVEGSDEEQSVSLQITDMVIG